MNNGKMKQQRLVINMFMQLRFFYVTYFHFVYDSSSFGYVRYGILAWGNISESGMQPINNLLNKAIRIITFAPYGPLDLKPIYK